MNKPHVERIGISRLGSREAVLAAIENGLGITFGRHGEPRWHPDSRRQVNDDMRALCALAADALCEKQANGSYRPIMDRIVTVDKGGCTPVLAWEFQKAIFYKTDIEVLVSVIEFEKEQGETRTRRKIKFDPELPRIISQNHEKVFLMTDVMEKGGHLVRLARAIQHNDLIDKSTGKRPSVVGIGAGVLRDQGLREHMREKLKYVPPLHFFVRCRVKRPAPSDDSESDAEIDSRYSFKPTPLLRTW